MIQIGKLAPNFEHVTAYYKGKFTKMNFSDYKGKWLVFFMYPRDFTFVCPTEIRGFAKHASEFEELGASILASSTDSEWSHKAWFEKDLPEVKYPILADTTQIVARDYHVLNENDGSAERGLFVIDPDGIIQYILISAGNVGRSVIETLRVLKAIQSGDLCPVEWEPGQETLGKA